MFIISCFFFFLMIRRPPRSTHCISSAASDVYKRQGINAEYMGFHKKIQELSGNRWLLSVIQDLRKVLKLSRLHSLSLEGRLQQSLDEHRLIMAALSANDATRAEKLMHDHLLSGREALEEEKGEQNIKEMKEIKDN
eukprot:TRINITY_DN4198_c0_g1_i9.p1 TRINITY_DN4198_c0_g1~~TRINITY_DN4198_c0_g1_i9.p1  ORF type:complete len:137 (-),score=48.67 TRINITY_DN4198_c0_g1_i9:69-479(-)